MQSQNLVYNAGSVDENQSLQDPETGMFGLKHLNGMPCLLLHFNAKLFKTKSNNSWKVETIPFLTSDQVTLKGHCASNDSRRATAVIKINWNNPEGDEATLTMHFKTASIKSAVKQLEELRWQADVTYSLLQSGSEEEYKSTGSAISAPFNQKYICRDKVNITLHDQNQRKMIAELEPEISIQPYNVENKHANLYVCERTKRRTLTESFNNRMTIFSGVILGLTSVSMLVIYSFKRQLHPSRQQLYQPFD